MYINRIGLLQHLYWGKKIGTEDAAFLVALLMVRVYSAASF